LGSKAAADSIRTRFRTAWAAVQPEVPVEYLGLPGHFSGVTGLTVSKGEPTGNHVRLSIEEAGGRIVAFGTRLDRHVGNVLLEIWTLDGQGDGPGRELCDAFAGIFRSLVLPDARIKFFGVDGEVPSPVFVGTKNGWMKWLCRAPFQRHEDVG
jgi:hypothetical protein